MDDPVNVGYCGIWWRGRSWPVWRYLSVPEGMRPAKATDLYQGRHILYQVSAGPDTGCYHTDIVRPSTYHPLLDMMRDGIPIFVK